MKKIILLTTIGMFTALSSSVAQELPKFKSEQEKIHWVNDNPESYNKLRDALKGDASKINSNKTVQLSLKKEETKKEVSTPNTIAKSKGEKSATQTLSIEAYERKNNLK